MFSLKSQIKRQQFVYALNTRTADNKQQIYTGVVVAHSTYEVLGILLEEVHLKNERITGWAIEDMPDPLPTMDTAFTMYPEAGTRTNV